MLVDFVELRLCQRDNVTVFCLLPWQIFHKPLFSFRHETAVFGFIRRHYLYSGIRIAAHLQGRAIKAADQQAHDRCKRRNDIDKVANHLSH
jgi:hypothetical protein